MTRLQLRAVLMRAGTSKGLFLRQDDLPVDRSTWNHVLLTAMGSPDPFGRQLNGVGGGSSTTSKIAIVGRSLTSGVDLDYTFVAAPIGGASLDFTGNCGNMASGVVPFAIEEGLLVPDVASGSYSATFRNTNTGIIMRATITLRNGMPVEEGDCRIDGVAETGGAIRLDFLNPAGAMTGKLLPTGQAVDELSLPDGTFAHPTIQASLVDAANPFVLVRASDLGLTGAETPAALAPHTALLMAIRCAGSVKMGLAKTIEAAALIAGTPKIAIVGRPMATTLAAGRKLNECDMDVQIRSFSMGAPHPSLQMTGAVCVAAACAIPGSIPNLLLNPPVGSAAAGNGQIPSPLRIAHASGVISTDAEITYNAASHSVTVHSASVYRTARRLFEGNVLCLIGNNQANPWADLRKPVTKPEPAPINLVLADKIGADRWLDAHAPRQDAQTV